MFETDDSSLRIHFCGDRLLQAEEFGCLVEKVQALYAHTASKAMQVIPCVSYVVLLRWGGPREASGF